jgi:glycosyltransferase involved in cell wall biosynthesis
MKSKIPLISVVVPIYNESHNISNLDKEIKEAIKKIPCKFEIIYINDGSDDGSLNELLTLKNITIINLSKHYGQSIALDAGFRQAAGQFIVTIDGDGQNNPGYIAELFDKLISGNFDFVNCRRVHRQTKKGIIFMSAMQKYVQFKLLGDDTHDPGCSLRIYRKKVIANLFLRGKMHRFISSLLKLNGYKAGEIKIIDRRRKFGKSKYGCGKAFKMSVDLLYIFIFIKLKIKAVYIWTLTALLLIATAIVFLVAKDSMLIRTLSGALAAILPYFIVFRNKKSPRQGII